MTLDPVHVDGIADLASHLANRVDDTDHDDLARSGSTRSGSTGGRSSNRSTSAASGLSLSTT